MLNIRPFRLTLYGLLLVTLGGSLVVYGARIADNKRLTYAEMLEQMASNANRPAVDQPAPSLELWDVGKTVMFAGSLFAIPGGLLLLTSAGIWVSHHYILPRVNDALEEAKQRRNPGLAADQDSDEVSNDEQYTELGHELLQADDARKSGPAVDEEIPTIIELEPPRPPSSGEAASNV